MVARSRASSTRARSSSTASTRRQRIVVQLCGAAGGAQRPPRGLRRLHGPGGRALHRHHCGSPEARAMATGCSMGAYHAVNFFLKHPDLREGTLALSGLYRLDRHEVQPRCWPTCRRSITTRPCPIPAKPQRPVVLDWYRRSTIIVCVGLGAWGRRRSRTRAAWTASSAKNRSPPGWTSPGQDVNHETGPGGTSRWNYFLGKLYG